MAELKWDTSVNAARIGVSAREGVVTLTGAVDSFVEKWAAERSAQRVFGVRGVAVAIDVMLPGPSTRTDADIARSADNVLEWTSVLPRERIKVMVENGWITLSGMVDHEFQRRAAESAVGQLMGVTGLTNQIGIAEHSEAAALKAEIEAALRRRTGADHDDVMVHVAGADVTLSGTVPTWFERELVTHAAWGTSGVRTVVDNISVS